MRFASITLLLIFLASTAATAEPTRLWMSADGSKSFRGKFVARDENSVTFKLEPSDRDATLPITKIHPEDIKWLDFNHPLPRKKDTSKQAGNHRNNPAGNAINSSKSGPAVFDTIALGDPYQVVFQKLKNSKNLKLAVPASMLGRTGLNGVYKTIDPVGGMPANLFFDWTASRQLKELSLHSDPQPRHQIEAKVVAGWKQLANEMTQIHGNPIRHNPRLDVAPIPDGGISFTHFWRLPNQGVAMLGASRVGDLYQLTLRFTLEELSSRGPVRQSP